VEVAVSGLLPEASYDKGVFAGRYSGMFDITILLFYSTAQCGKCRYQHMRCCCLEALYL
jgi:hypothetical protein